MQRRLQSRFGMRMLDAKTVFMMATKPVSHIAQSARLPDRLREVLRYKHCSLRTQECVSAHPQPGEPRVATKSRSSTPKFHTIMRHGPT